MGREERRDVLGREAREGGVVGCSGGASTVKVTQVGVWRGFWREDGGEEVMNGSDGCRTTEARTRHLGDEKEREDALEKQDLIRDQL